MVIIFSRVFAPDTEMISPHECTNGMILFNDNVTGIRKLLRKTTI